MSTKKTIQVQFVPIKSVVPDDAQPRQNFDSAKMHNLQSSISKYGIITPIIVQDMGSGKYLIEDGERRWRAAKELDLQEVPVVVREATNATDRLIQQFNIQEQHETWNPLEKAQAIIRLSEEMGISLRQTCILLGLNGNDQRRYQAFAELADRKSFARNEIPLEYASHMRSLNNRVRSLKEKVLEEDFSNEEQKRFENRVIQMVKNGIVTKGHDLLRVSDSLTKNPKLIEKFMNDSKVTPTSLYAESKAKGAFELRNVSYGARSLMLHGRSFLSIRDVKISTDQLALLKEARDVANELIGLAE